MLVWRREENWIALGQCREGGQLGERAVEAGHAEEGVCNEEGHAGREGESSCHTSAAVSFLCTGKQKGGWCLGAHCGGELAGAGHEAGGPRG